MNTKAYSSLFIAGTVALYTSAFAHGNVTPQSVDVAGIPPVGEEWLEENPYRTLDGADKESVIEVGSSAYNQNCARCHGLEAISGGIAPDLRKLQPTAYDDQWYLERVRNGYTAQNGAVMMPPFEETFSQEAMWAIRTYTENQPLD